MEDLVRLEDDVLVDMLSESTTKYLSMISEGRTMAEIDACRDTVEAIIREIRKRQAPFKSGENITIL